MKKKVLIIIYVILILITLKLFYNMLIDNVLISNYNNGKYSENQAKMLTFLNFSQPYIANYNYGNVLYKNGEYEQAIEKYKKALKGIVPKNKECNIRINYALSICKTVSVNEKDQNSINNAIEKYESAIQILTEKGCADKDDNNGHNKKAEQLKEDIQKEINRLKNLQEHDSNTNKDNDEKNKTEENVDTIEEKIQEVKENATKDQRKTENDYKNFGDFDYNRVKKNW